MLNFLKKTEISTKKMQWSRIIITYLILWEKLALNGAKIMKFGFGGEKIELGKFREWGIDDDMT